MPKRIRVFLCDSHTLFRQGVKKLLEQETDINVVGDTSEALEMLGMLKKAAPDVILMDLSMNEIDGISAVNKVRKALPGVNIVVLTSCEAECCIFGAIKAGVKGYLLKTVSVDELLEALRRVYKGEAQLQPVIASKVLREFAMMDKRKIKESDKLYDDLTKKQKEVLRLIALGGTNKEIANKLGISEKTVKNHISNIFQTLQINNRTKAALYALGKTQ